MSYGQWNIDKDKTIESYGYNPETLSYGSKKPVCCVCINCGMEAILHYRSSNKKHICKSVINGFKKCFKCKETMIAEDCFSKNKSTYDGYQKVCKNCFSNYNSVKNGYKKKNNNIKTNLTLYLRNKIANIKHRCKLKNIEFNLSDDYINKLFLEQKGLCYFTNIPMVHNEGQHQYNSISIERLDPSIGYIDNNVKLCLFSLNSFKGMMNESEFKSFLKEILPKLKEYSEI
jgi:hypothetical protein